MSQYYVSLEMIDREHEDYDLVIGPYRSCEVATKVAERIQRKIDRTPVIQSLDNNFFAVVGVRRLRTPAEARREFQEWIDDVTRYDEDGDE